MCERELINQELKETKLKMEQAIEKGNYLAFRDLKKHYDKLIKKKRALIRRIVNGRTIKPV